MILEMAQLLRMHRAILTKNEKKHFLLLSLLFLISSIFDIVGIGTIGYFLTLMMDPTLLDRLPLLRTALPKSWNFSQILQLMGAIILIVFLSKTILSCLIQKQLISYCFRIGARIRIYLMEQYLYAPYSYFVSNHTSDLINQILNYSTNYANWSLVSFMTMLVHTIFVSALIIFLLFFKPFITLFLISMFFGMLVIHLLIVRNKLYQAGLNINLTGQQIVQSVQEGLSGLKEVRILSKEDFFLTRIKKASTLNAEANGIVAVYQKLPLYFLESIMFIFIISLCLLELGIGMNVQEVISLTGVLVATGIRLLPSLYQISVAAVSTQSSKPTLKIIYDNLCHFNKNFKNESCWPKNHGVLQQHPEPKNFSIIEIANVSYKYPNANKFALESVTLNIKRGQSIGIIGPSGAGKSTLIDLLLGLLTPNEGKIFLDGLPMSDKRTWVDRFAYIPQTIHLLDATIKQNIIFGETDNKNNKIDEVVLEHAIEMAQLGEVIASLPNGLDTLIGENGIRLSGGQRQRVALARAFYHEREIIVMDEATAALDNETEREVVEAIKRLHKLKTLIIIAHRYTTVKHCDMIYRLNEGKIVEAGSFNEVIGQHQLNQAIVNTETY